jgi:hypothetical protein
LYLCFYRKGLENYAIAVQLCANEQNSYNNMP